MVANTDIRDRTKNRLQNIDTAITDAIILEMVNDAIQDVANRVGVSISTSDIAAKYQPAITSLAAAYVLSRQMNVGVTFSNSLGEFSVDPASEARPEAQQIKFFLEQAERSIQMIGVSMPYAKTWGSSR